MNSRSATYKELGLGERTLPIEEIVTLMLQDRNLIRRPILLAGEDVIFGFSPEHYDRLA